MTTKIPIRKNDLQVVGYVDVDAKTYYRYIKDSQKLKTPPAWAMDNWSLEQIYAAGGFSIEFIDLDNNTIYQTDIDTFNRHGFPIDRGHGKQRGLELKWWKKMRADTRDEIQDEEERIKNMQPGLFDEKR